MKIKCIIVDDEPPARKVVRELIAEFDFLEYAGEAEHPMKAQILLREQAVDLIFLDIQMPKTNGLDFLRQSRNLPPVIITTAFPDYAFDGFELEVLDYLLKPITAERFQKAALKALDFIYLKRNSNYSQNYSGEFFFVKHDGKYQKVIFEEIIFVEALSNYVQIHTVTAKLLVYSSLRSIHEQLPPGQFIQIHKSYIVGVSKVIRFDTEEVILPNTSLPLSRSYKDEFLKKMNV